MGRLLLIGRLVLRDLRRRPGEALVFLLAVTVASTSLILGLATGNAVDNGYEKTRAATAGPDIIATTTAADPSGVAARLADAPGVAEQAEPVFAFDTYLKAYGKSAHTAVEGRDTSQDAAVDQPLVTSGTWVRPGGAVLERGFAKALGVSVGDHVTVSGRDYPVVGTAISTATSVYPWSDDAQGPGTSDFGGRMWLTSADTRKAAGDDPGVHLIYLKLDDPTATQHWMNTTFAGWSETDGWVNTHDWQDVLQTDKAMIRSIQPALVVGGWLLAVAAIVTLAALATARAARDNRRAALLKAVGAGPATVTAALLAQYLLLALLATAIGLTAGTLAAPHLVDPSAGLLNTVGPPDFGSVFAAVLLAVIVAVTGALRPALRAARTSTVNALTDPAHLPTRHPRLNAVTAYLPASLLLGIRLLARRPGRAVLAGAGSAATTLMVTALLTWHTELAARPDFTHFGPIEVRADQTGRVLLAVTLVLVAMSTLNTVLLGLSTAVQARRALSVARTLGATPGQVVTALCVAGLLPAAPGIAVGIPAGLGLYWLFGTQVTPPGTWLLATALAILLAVAVLTALPAWAHTRSPVGHGLGVEPV
ncbi:FtsX-like permease family protein [Streptomyces sp. NBRC 110028]|uniref:FtsX-like permease family protein n=1 Tax=Streptomyces sp. NBRC 110028 TaxID=1621260 RepID=UPI0006E3F66A|nr:FtsX-like permease family protein [Streptomyces sp. NBRC 110028]